MVLLLYTTIVFPSHFNVPLVLPEVKKNNPAQNSKICGRNFKIRGLPTGRSFLNWSWTMSGAPLCELLCELGYEEGSFFPDSLEWPFQYEEARPILNWLCSSLRPSNVLSPSDLNQLHISYPSPFFYFYICVCLPIQTILYYISTLPLLENSFLVEEWIIFRT